MNISARNQLKGTIKSINKGDVTAEIVVEIGGQELVSVITSSSVDRLHLEIGDQVAAMIKATEVMIAK